MSEDGSLREKASDLVLPLFAYVSRKWTENKFVVLKTKGRRWQ